MHRLCHILLFLLPMISIGQNLVPNGSFEEYNSCPNAPGHIWRTNNWQSVKGSIDFFTSCGEVLMWSVPSNVRDYQTAYEGESYCGFALWALNLTNGREFIGVQLTDSLQQGHKYIFKMMVSLTDSSRYAVSSIGAYLSASQPSNDLSSLLLIEPQVSNASLTFLTDTSDWMQVQGEIIAEGGESYLTIGNFNNDQETDTLLVDLANQSSPAWNVSGYYLDHVSLIEDTTYQVGIEEPVFAFSI